MEITVNAEQVSKLLIRIAFRFQRGRGHDESPVDELVAVVAVGFLDGVKLLRRHRNPGQFGPEY
jgi:hypothetical protein